MDTKQTPALRFKGFAGEWETKKIGELCTETTETVNPMETPNAYFTEYSMPAFDNGMTADAVIGKSMNSLRKVVREPSLLVNKLNVRKKRIWNVLAPESNAVCSAEFVPLTAKNSDLNFLQCILLTDEFTSYLEDHSSGSSNSQKRVTPDVITNAQIVVPSHEEQKEIGACFARLDAVLALARRRAERLAAVKRAMLAALFPKEGKTRPALRFQGFSGEWQRKRLGDLADIVGGGTPSTGIASYWDGDINWYSPAEIADQIFVRSSQRKITQEGYDNCSARMLPIGTVLFTSRAGIGKTAILVTEGCTNQGFQSIVPRKGKLDSYFIFARTDELKAYGECVGAGSTFVEVSGKQMADMNLMMPPTIEEQKMIGAYFRRLDEIISLQARRTEKLTALKKALLGRMFV